MTPTKASDPLQRVWTIPNIISVLRLLVFLPLTVVALIRSEYVLALASLIALGLTDWLDGFLARWLGQVSELGKIMDPLADRLSVIVVGFAMTVVGIIPWEFIAAIFLTDLLLSIATVIWFRGNPDLEVSMIGKVRTAVVLVSLPILILGQASSHAWIDYLGIGLLTVGTIGHVIAGAGYLMAMYRLHRARITA